LQVLRANQFAAKMAAGRSPPSIGRLDLSSAHNPEIQAGTLNSGRVPLSARRLSKSVLHADSNRTSSNAAGIVMLKDSEGTPRAVRVVQKEESENRNIVRVGWIWSTDGQTYQIELRHGRKSGIRKIYINKRLVDPNPNPNPNPSPNPNPNPRHPT
jgi:hypothetical protein